MAKDRSIVILDGGRRLPRADILLNNKGAGLVHAVLHYAALWDGDEGDAGQYRDRSKADRPRGHGYGRGTVIAIRYMLHRERAGAVVWRMMSGSNCSAHLRKRRGGYFRCI